MLYVGIASLALGLTVIGGWEGVEASIAAFATAAVSSLVITKAAKHWDLTSVATFRRAAAAVLVGDLIWFACSAAGLVYSMFQATGHSAGNAVVFGGFICAGFEFLVVNGAFVQRTSASAATAVVHPLVTTLAFLSLGLVYDFTAIIPGAVALVIIVSFTLALGRTKTSQGHDALRLFRAFMKTWANDNASELEAIIDAHASNTEVFSKVFRFRQDSGDTFIILPGVHPGPFYPIGSYNLPALISSSFEGLGRVLTLHGPGGHENNLATNASAKRYAADLRAFAQGVSADAEASVRGPVVTKMGKATVSAMGFIKDLLITISFAPHGSDDLEVEAGQELVEAARSGGYDAALVDAHNSIRNEREQFDPHDGGWSALIRSVTDSAPTNLRVGYAHSREVDLPPSGDLTSTGMALMMFEANGTKWALLLADANNAVPELRQTVSEALTSAGYALLEFCTSDSHDLAARGLTVNRGYHALGEVTPPTSLAEAAVKLASLAESRLAGCRYGSGGFKSGARVFGSKALREFAEITQKSSRFAKAYAQLAIPSLLLLLAASLLV